MGAHQGTPVSTHCSLASQTPFWSVQQKTTRGECPLEWAHKVIQLHRAANTAGMKREGGKTVRSH